MEHFYKIHKLNCPDKPKSKPGSNPKYNCLIGKKNHRESFGTEIKEQDDDHMSKHRRPEK
jgi:hypothetical protein